MNAIAVSVIIPVYNAGETLEATLDSVCAQTLQDIEVICVDDGSTDRSAQILNVYAERDNRFKIIAQENAGAGAARNKGLAAAKGKYLSFLDADDLFEPDMLADAAGVCEKYDADYCVFDFDLFSDDPQERIAIDWAICRWELPETIPFSHNEIKQNVFLAFTPNPWNKLFSADFIRRAALRFQEIKNTNDMFFTFSALFHAKKIVPIDKVLAHYRTNHGQTLSYARENSWDCFFQALAAVKAEMMKLGLYEKYEQQYANTVLNYFLWQLDRLKGPSFFDCYDRFVKEWAEASGLTGRKDGYFYKERDLARLKAILQGNPVDYLVYFHESMSQYIPQLEMSNGMAAQEIDKMAADIRALHDEIQKVTAERNEFGSAGHVLKTDNGRLAHANAELADELARIKSGRAYRLAERAKRILRRRP